MVMSMTKNEFMRRCRILRWGFDYGEPLDSEIAAIAEEAGIEWDPEPTPEPTGDPSMVRVIDAEGDTWGPASSIVGWVRVGGTRVQPWSGIPQPATVLRPEGDGRA